MHDSSTREARHARSTVARAEDRQTLLAYLSGRFTYHDCAGWQQQIDAGRLLVNGSNAGAATLLHSGDVVEYLIPAVAEPAVDFAYEIVYADAQMLVINKPANLPCHPGGKFFAHTLWACLREQGIGKPTFINRLDRETSGLVVVGLDAPSSRNLQQQFALRQVDKRYVVAVEGQFPDDYAVSGMIVPDGASVVRKKQRFIDESQCGPQPDSCRAQTYFHCLQRHGGISLVAARPLTGRLHQIRATLCSLGFAVVGDKLYGVDENLFLRFCTNELSAADHVRLRLPRQALHAQQLSLRHPQSGELLQFNAPLPADICGLGNRANRAIEP